MSANDESSNNEEEDNIEVTIENELQKTIGDAFLLFTSENNRQSISVTDLGKVIRHIGCVPSELELKEFAKEVVNPKYPKIIKINVFMRHMEMQVRAFRYRPGTAIELLQAFQLLDMDRKGSLSIEEIETALKGGESFDDDEIAYAIKSSYDPDNECIYYDTWINKLLGKTKTDIYALIPVDKLDEKDAVLKQLLGQNQNKL
ncbi:dynein regulatory complex protein 8-like [Daktulosphaira vitifoliae]|uniref:dynein regulatory complex protein 8-like n=1 Tax=Daktulosphaira vitifoliae TaxID=58002 RepID=UPI0021AA54D5|nr:dynein regulatory complex protein 8-like [Daktulosphaira vitifoliae]